MAISTYSKLLFLITFLTSFLILSFLLDRFVEKVKILNVDQTTLKSVEKMITSFLLPSPTPVTTKDQNKVNSSELQSAYPLHSDIEATVFWIGEEASSANGYIHNLTSSWDVEWVRHYGGMDDPNNRNGYYPQTFIPNENPFYFALPYNDFNESGRKENAKKIPWYEDNVPQNHSLVKNRWIRIFHKKQVCYAQWEDVGPWEHDDFTYVFLGQKPKRDQGIDLSPAVRDCLGMKNKGTVKWQFVDEPDVPSGPWKKIITTSQIMW